MAGITSSWRQSFASGHFDLYSYVRSRGRRDISRPSLSLHYVHLEWHPCFLVYDLMAVSAIPSRRRQPKDTQDYGDSGSVEVAGTFGGRVARSGLVGALGLREEGGFLHRGRGACVRRYGGLVFSGLQYC